VIKSALLKLE